MCPPGFSFRADDAVAPRGRVEGDWEDTQVLPYKIIFPSLYIRTFGHVRLTSARFSRVKKFRYP